MNKTVKCVVWDLDNTLWQGVLLEDGDVRLLPAVAEVIRELDRRGILQCVASRNDHDSAVAALRRFDLLDCFVELRVGWGVKSASISSIARALNLGLDTFAFVDDDEFERAEVAFALPDVRCVDAADAAGLADAPEFAPEFITVESRQRRALYRAEQIRKATADAFTGPESEFLAGLDMRLDIAVATEDDLARAEELTVRTNQLNTTGRTYSRAELDAFRTAPDHGLFVARLTDRFGPYGTIGLSLIQRSGDAWTVKLLLMSCRVLSRGVGTVLITYLRQLARTAGARLRADFVRTERNRMMYVTYRMNGFREIGTSDTGLVLEADPANIPPFPQYVRVRTPEAGVAH